MDFNIGEYWELLTKYTNPFSILISCLKYAALAFFVFLLLVIFLRKFILVKRRYLVFKIFAWTYIILIPIIAGFFGFKWGLIQGVKNDLKTHLSAYTTGMDALLTGALGRGADDFVTELTTGKDSVNRNISADEAVENFSDLIAVNFETTIDKKILGDGKVKNKAATVLLRMTKSATISYGLKYAIRKLLHDELGIEEGASKKLMAKKFNDLLNKGLFTSIMEIQIERFFSGMQKSLYILFSLILLFPVTETIISNVLYRKKLKKERTMKKEMPVSAQ